MGSRLLLKSHQLVISERQTIAHHASTVLPLGDGRALVAYFGGSREGRDDVGIWLCEKDEGGFHTPRRVAFSDEPHWNPVLFERKNGEIMLFYKVGSGIPGWRTMLITSSDGGKSWSRPEPLIAGDTTGGRGPVRNKPIYLKSGRILAPGSTETGVWRCFVDISDDGGLTWRRTDDIFARDTRRLDQGVRYWYELALAARERGEDFDPSRIPPEYAHGRGIIQPTLWEDDSGVHALMRSGEGFIYRADSADDGETWTEAYPTDLPNNNSGIDLARLPGGELLLCMNPVSGNFAARSPISLFLSSDGGAGWTRLMDLEGGAGEYSYPAVVCRDGRVYITYTWKRENIAWWEFKYESDR